MKKYGHDDDSQRETATKSLSLAKGEVQAYGYASRPPTRMVQMKFQAWNRAEGKIKFQRQNFCKEIDLAFISGTIEGAGVVARVAGADACRFDRMVWKVPYLLDSPFKPGVTASPDAGCDAVPGGSKNDDAVASSGSTSSSTCTEL